MYLCEKHAELVREAFDLTELDGLGLCEHVACGAADCRRYALSSKRYARKKVAQAAPQKKDSRARYREPWRGEQTELEM